MAVETAQLSAGRPADGARSAQGASGLIAERRSDRGRGGRRLALREEGGRGAARGLGGGSRVLHLSLHRSPAPCHRARRGPAVAGSPPGSARRWVLPPPVRSSRAAQTTGSPLSAGDGGGEGGTEVRKWSLHLRRRHPQVPARPRCPPGARLRELLLVPPRRALTDLQLIKVMRPQYLGAPVASRTPNPAASPNSIKPKIIPSSRTMLLNHRNTVPASS
ncbi:uncharacterized protein LOC142093456 [Calonectris borealis]|uniref:uncharacterized protein LOC142093456 n=1 Tax=Calonectris borealis TaxID=1323832 RepID=UPI003F4C11E4